LSSPNHMLGRQAVRFRLMIDPGAQLNVELSRAGLFLPHQQARCFAAFMFPTSRVDTPKEISLKGRRDRRGEARGAIQDSIWFVPFEKQSIPGSWAANTVVVMQLD